MHNSLYTNQELIILFRLIIAHLLSDFILQTDKMVKNKKWVSREMFSHIGIVYLTTALFSFLWWQSILITIIHYLIDGTKISLKKTEYFQKRETQLFIIDQLGHLLTILLVWMWIYPKENNFFHLLNDSLNHYNTLVLIIGYISISYPLGHLIGIATSKIGAINDLDEKTDKNGLNIGIFERIIILTFVLLTQYEAIGFLITGKSILRFGANNENKKSEYVLLGTMMSYAITIVFGLLIKETLTN
jgi:hypothetical protein